MKIFILSHSTGIKGPGDFLEDFLLQNKHTVFKLEHPLDTYFKRKSILSKNKKTLQVIQRYNLSLLNYFIDLGLGIKYLYGNTYNVFIGANNFDTLTGIIAKKIFQVKIQKIIYFASDFSENRFNNKTLDAIYTSIEKTVLKQADLTVSNTQRAENKRIEIGLTDKKSIVIPNGIFLKHPFFREKKIEKDSFIYVGNVTKEHGIVEFVESLSPLMKRLVIIGQGDEWEILKGITKKKKIETEFYYMKNHDFVIKFLQGFRGFGLAPYTKYAKWTYYSSSLKIVEYIACGVPVVTSDITEISKRIEKDNLGIVYHNLAIEEMKKRIKNFETHSFYKKAKEFYTQYNSYELLKGIDI